ncbi:MAG: tetratricopeptide repeat protein [Ignavibacteria bacterium]|nr:tetratricopeptide repeat protein [Ignavibacteria bacterium]
MNIPLLEERLAANPRSPLFARLASCYAREGRFEEAIDLCTKGLKDFPEYPTAHLVLAECYQSTGRTVEALIEYRRVLKAVPDNPSVVKILRLIEKREQEAFHAFAEERLKQLKVRKGPMPQPAGKSQEVEQPKVARKSGNEGKIVTVTLAEIYASQGEYEEAVQVYRRLTAEKGDKTEEFAKRISELEQLARARAAEIKT